ncbi:MAG: chromosomal replication initiator protein DnaA [Clostridia bacterium]|nr:chromosomal replication initiator protein DnaA [Clostridia bacterium]
MGLDSLSELWEAACEESKKYICDVGFNVWIRDLKPVSLQSGVLILSIYNDIKKGIFNDFYKDRMEECLLEVSGLPLKIEVMVAGEGQPQDEPVVFSARPSGDASYTFDNFIVGSSNRFAHAASLAVAESPTVVYSPLFIYGNSGVGKTHLVLAIKNRINEKFPDKIVEYMRGEEFGNRIIEAIHSHTTKLFHDRYRSVDVLIIDDIHFIAGKDSIQEEFFNTFNVLSQAGKQVIITSDRPPKEIDNMDIRIRSRFESGLITDMSPPDFETRVGIIRTKAAAANIDIDEEIVFFVAEQIKMNTRQLEGVVKKLQAYIQIQKREPSISAVQGLIKDIINDSKSKPVTIERIVEEVSRTLMVSVEDIMSPRRSADILYARQVAIYIAKEVTQLSFLSIGKAFNLHHTTIIHSVSKIEPILKNDKSKRYVVEEIIKNLTNN